MSKLITRRRALLGGLAALGGGVAFARRPDQLPPTYGHLLRAGDALTYSAHRILLPGGALARQYDRADITSFPATGMTDPGRYLDTPLGEEYRRLRAEAFVDWRLEVGGLVATPRSFSLADLQALPARTQITRHTCEEGWTAIGEWTGVPLARLLEAAGMKPSARYVVTHSYDQWADCIDMNDVLHPQTLLAYGMNGRDLPVAHGAPVRLRVERQMGYKSMKYLRRIVVTDEFNAGDPSFLMQAGWSWYTGI
ncbi:MAG: molybdopterin-dependent oxidoreductase [Thermoanaerobaculia bacterium]|nr:molybdopterin-dependent oxidoreductase [Thermoanaerobaculia bacterium]